MAPSIGSSTSADANSLVRSLMDQSENTRSLVTSNGGLTKPTRSQPPTTEIPKIGASTGKTANSTSTQAAPAAANSWNDSLKTSMAGRSKMLSASAQGIQASASAQILDPNTAASQTSRTARGLSSQVQTSLLAQANATPEIALRLLE